jgi:predicted N-acetyltransferase YhbS
VNPPAIPRLLDATSPEAHELARLQDGLWNHLYRSWSTESAGAEYRTHRKDGGLPATLIIEDNGAITGSVSVLSGDCEARPDLDPWLGNLWVAPSRRGQGLAGRLIEEAIRLAAANGQRQLHVFTESAEPLFVRHGFRRIDRPLLHGHAVTVLVRDLEEPAS